MSKNVKKHHQLYENFWKDIIEPDGKLDKEALMNELYNYYMLTNLINDFHKSAEHIQGERSY